MVVNRFDVWLVDVDPVKGSEISKTRPCLVISPDEANRHLNTVIVTAMTTAQKNFPTRVDCVFKRKKGQIALDQIRTINKMRLVKKLGAMDEAVNKKVSEFLGNIFSY